MTRKLRPDFPLGSISTGTLRTEDMAQAALDAIDLLIRYGYAGVRESASIWKDLDKVSCNEWENRAIATNHSDTDVLDDAERFIDDHTPEYVRFGALEGDGADIGFWPCIGVLEEDRRDEEIPELEKMPKGYRGLAVDVSDHGNISLYRVSRSGTFCIWACV